MEKIAMARGFKKKGDEPDLERAGKILMDELSVAASLAG